MSRDTAGLTPPAEFTEAAADRLIAFLGDPKRPEGTLGYGETCGLLFAICGAPDLVEPSEWLPLIFNDGTFGAADQPDARQVLGDLMALYNWTLHSVDEETGSAALPPRCAPRPEPMENFADDAPLARWSRGFILGYTWLEDTWNQALPEDEFDEEMGAGLMTLSFFSSLDLAREFVRDAEPPATAEALATEILEAIPHAMTGYALLGRSLYEEAHSPLVKPPKTGRNDPCPCGSGRKYKKCCGVSAYPH